VYRTSTGVAISYPPDWQVATDRSGLIAIAGPRATWGRPIATVTVLRGGGDPQATVEFAARTVADPASLRLLGAQQIGPNRRAKYYVLSDQAGAMDAYVMVGSAEGKTAAVVIVGIDPLRDPDLRVRASVFQALLLRLVLP
jgi:hypothetical protein